MSSATNTATTTSKSLWHKITHIETLRDTFGLIVVYIAIFIILSVLSEFFLTSQNLINLLLATATIGIVAVFTTMLMVSGGLDLSVGSTIALTGIMIAILQEPLGIWPAALIGLLTGGLIGIINGFLVTRIGINPVITTLGMLYTARGLAFVLSDGLTKPVFEEQFSRLGQEEVLSIPFPVLVALVLFVGGAIVMNYTTYGRALYAVGGNAEASFLAALPVKRYRWLAYILSGFSAGLAGVLLTSRLYAAAPQAATGFEFSAIAAVVLGGTSLAGGKGTLVGTFVGVMILGTLNNGMTLLSLSSDYQQMVQGFVLLLAVGIDQFRLGNIDIAVLRKNK